MAYPFHGAVYDPVALLASLACILSLAIATLVLVGLNDGGWLLLVPAIGAAAVIVWPVRSVLTVAIVLNAAIMILGLLSVGILYGFSLAALIFALAALRPDRQVTALTRS